MVASVVSICIHEIAARCQRLCNRELVNTCSHTGLPYSYSCGANGIGGGAWQGACFGIMLDGVAKAEGLVTRQAGSGSTVGVSTICAAALAGSVAISAANPLGIWRIFDNAEERIRVG